MRLAEKVGVRYFEEGDMRRKINEAKNKGIEKKLPREA